MVNASGAITRRAWQGAAAALLLQALFIVPFDRRPAYALLAFMALGALTASLLWGAARDRALWGRLRGALGSWPMLLGLAFAAWGALRWSFMLLPYAGRPWVMGLAWMGVGLTLGAILGARDRAAAPASQKNAAGFRRVLILAALAFGALRAAQGAGFLTPLPSPPPIYLCFLCVSCLASLAGGEALAWRALAALGAILAGAGVFITGTPGLFAAMPPLAQTVFSAQFLNGIVETVLGAGPGALTLAIAHRTSLGAAAPIAIEAWRFRLPAELGAAGLILFVAFLVQLARLFPLRASAPQPESRRFIILTFALSLLGLLGAGLGRPEMMLLFGLLAGVSIGLAEHAPKLRPYHGRLAGAVCLVLALGALAGAMTFRQQIAWRHNLRGYTCLAQGRWEDAMKSFDKATRWQPDDPEHWLGLARVYPHTTQVGHASAYLAVAAYHDPLRPDITVELAHWSAGRGRLAEAAVEMSVALQQDPLKVSYRREMETYDRLAKAAAGKLSAPAPSKVAAR